MLDPTDLHSIVQACNAAAAQAPLPPSAVAWCSETYLALKLSFVPGMTLDAYAALDAAGRAAVNREGYAGLRAWMEIRSHAAQL